MKRVLLVTGVFSALALDCAAQETSIRLHVQPMPAATPALKYQLLPCLNELNPGNAAQNYLKCFMEQHAFFFSKRGVTERDRYESMPLVELAREKQGGYGGNALRQADWAARMESLDWQSLGSIQGGGIEGPPSEVGPIQVLAKALHVRFRAEVAERNFDKAVGTAKTMFALSRHLGEHPTEVANLVGLWVAHLGLNALEEMVQQAKCPNLYWALTDLPSPLVDLRKGVQGEQFMVAAEMRVIRGDSPMTEAELEGLISRLSGVISFTREQSGQPPRSVRAALRALAKDPESLGAARRRLIDSGCTEEAAGKFPPLQIVLLDQKRRHEIERDERLKLLCVPVWQAAYAEPAGKSVGGVKWPLADLLPNIEKLRAEQAELERQVALLRYVEAVRLHAAGHDGMPAARLADIAVPLPLDPVTGKPFGYSVDGTTAHISTDSLPATGKGPGRAVHYSVTIHK
jgi:hypothetical protein